jgi:Holliday junction resolvase
LPNRKYQKGVRFERKVKQFMESTGYTVLRAAGSHGVFDLACVTDYGQVEFIQCKSDRSSAKTALQGILKKFTETDSVSYSVAFPSESVEGGIAFA